MDNTLADQVMQILEEEMTSFKESVQEASWMTSVDLARKVEAACPKDSGATAASAYATEGANGRSTYEDAVGTSQGKLGGGSGKTVHMEYLPEEQAMQSSTIHESIVAVAAKSGFMLENGFGPEGSRTPQPFFDQTVADAESIFADHLANELKS